MKTHRFSSRHTVMLTDANINQSKLQEDQGDRITAEKLEEIKRIHEIHFKLKRG